MVNQIMLLVSTRAPLPRQEQQGEFWNLKKNPVFLNVFQPKHFKFLKPHLSCGSGLYIAVHTSEKNRTTNVDFPHLAFLFFYLVVLHIWPEHVLPDQFPPGQMLLDASLQLLVGTAAAAHLESCFELHYLVSSVFWENRRRGDIVLRVALRHPGASERK